MGFPGLNWNGSEKIGANPRHRKKPLSRNGNGFSVSSASVGRRFKDGGKSIFAKRIPPTPDE
jgi:hypothetical protein